MTRTPFRPRLGAPAAAALLASLLAGCGSSDDPGAPATVSGAPTAAGRYTLALGDSSAPTTGEAYVAADGSRLLIVNDSSDQATATYTATADGGWTRQPDAAATSVTLLNSASAAANTLDLATVKGTYVAKVNGNVARFTLASTGVVTSDSSATCKVSGKISTTEWTGGVRRVTIALAGCGDVPSSLDGYAIADTDYAPAPMRIVLANGTKLLDLLAYSE